MRTLAFALPLVFTLACASSPPAESSEESPPPAQPAEVEGPKPASDPAAAEAAAGLCTPASYEKWSACEGKRTRVEGSNAKFVQQHPLMSQPEGLSPDNRNTYQGYMDADHGAQVIVLTSAPFECRGKMTVIGDLQGIRGNGPEGTKDSYGGWAFSNAEVTCN